LHGANITNRARRSTSDLAGAGNMYNESRQVRVIQMPSPGMTGCGATGRADNCDGGGGGGGDGDLDCEDVGGRAAVELLREGAGATARGDTTAGVDAGLRGGGVGGGAAPVRPRMTASGSEGGAKGSGPPVLQSLQCDMVSAGLPCTYSSSAADQGLSGVARVVSRAPPFNKPGQGATL
jgi:hypothetical protein